MIRKLAHICLVTDRLEAMLDFYTRGLGLSVKFIFRNKDQQIFGYYLNCGDSSFIEIFDRELKNRQWGGDLQTLKPGDLINHFCFEVIDLAQHKEALEARGVKVVAMKTGMDQSKQAWTSDPDGNSIEFMEYTRASWQFAEGEGAR